MFFSATYEDEVDANEVAIDVDDPQSWEELPESEMVSVNSVIDASSKKERLSMFLPYFTPDCI